MSIHDNEIYMIYHHGWKPVDILPMSIMDFDHTCNFVYKMCKDIAKAKAAAESQ